MAEEPGLEDDTFDQLSSSPSIHEEEIDFQYVYALRTFVATEQGQANAYKGDAMILLNDTNSYWWLVRLVKDSSVGFLPAEHIETPWERLARLNKHRNGDLSSPNNNQFSNLSSKTFGKMFAKSNKKKSAKSVSFTNQSTYVSASEYEYSDDEAEDNDNSDDERDAEEEEGEEDLENNDMSKEKQDNVDDKVLIINSNSNEEATNEVKSIMQPTDDNTIMEELDSFNQQPLVIQKIRVSPPTDESTRNSKEQARDEIPKPPTKKSSSFFSLMKKKNSQIQGEDIGHAIISEDLNNKPESVIGTAFNPTSELELEEEEDDDKMPPPNDKSVRRRSLLKTKSSVEQFSKKTSNNKKQISPLPSPTSPTHSTSSSSAFSKMFKRKKSRENSSISSTSSHSPTSSTVSPTKHLYRTNSEGTASIISQESSLINSPVSPKDEEQTTTRHLVPQKPLIIPSVQQSAPINPIIKPTPIKSTFPSDSNGFPTPRVSIQGTRSISGYSVQSNSSIQSESKFQVQPPSDLLLRQQKRQSLPIGLSQPLPIVDRVWEKRRSEYHIIDNNDPIRPLSIIHNAASTINNETAEADTSYDTLHDSSRDLDELIANASTNNSSPLDKNSPPIGNAPVDQVRVASNGKRIMGPREYNPMLNANGIKRTSIESEESDVIITETRVAESLSSSSASIPFSDQVHEDSPSSEQEDSPATGVYTLNGKQTNPWSNSTSSLSMRDQATTSSSGSASTLSIPLSTHDDTLPLNVPKQSNYGMDLRLNDLHPDIVPIFRDTSERLGQLSSKLDALLQTYR